MHSVSNITCEGLLLKTINRIMASLNNTIAINQMGLWWTAVAKRKLSLRVWVHSSFCKVYLDYFFLKIRYRRITSWIHKTLPMGQTQGKMKCYLPKQFVSRSCKYTRGSCVWFASVCCVSPFICTASSRKAVMPLLFNSLLRDQQGCVTFVGMFQEYWGIPIHLLVRIIYRFQSKTAECCLLIFFLLI